MIDNSFDPNEGNTTSEGGGLTRQEMERANSFLVNPVS